MSREMIIDPREVDFSNLDAAFSPPDVAHFSQPNGVPDFESLRPGQVHTRALSRYRDRQVAEVMRRIFDVHAGDFYIPGMEFRDWVVEHYDSAPDQVKRALAPLADGNWYLFFGSMVRNSNGRWGVPYALRVVSVWRRGVVWTDEDWMSSDRGVLLEID